MAQNHERFPEILVRGNALVRMTERGELEALGPESLADRLSRVCEFGKTAQGGWEPADPPERVARTLLARDSAEYVDAPRVEQVVDVPVLGPDGRLVAEPGYDARSRLYYRPAPGLGDLEIPPEPQLVEEVVEARDFLLDELLGDFCFADQPSRAHALALLIEPFVRLFIGDSSTPLYLVHAHDAGMGKGLLTDAALAPGVGSPSKMAGTASDEEWRKRVTSALIGGGGAVVLDNLDGALNSPALAAALTATEWRDRILGTNKEAKVPVRTTWVATGNNLDLSPELTRRAVPIFLERPDGRRQADMPKDQFRHPDLAGWARARRAELARCALVLVRHWADGRATTLPGNQEFLREDPEDRARAGRMLGSFERWSQVVGGVLSAADVPGFLGNRDRLDDQVNEREREAAAFLAAWQGLGLEPLTQAELVPRCQLDGQLHDALPSDLMSSGRELPRRLTYWLRDHRGRLLGGRQLEYQEGAATPAAGTCAALATICDDQ